MVLGVERILSGGVELVNLSLQPCVGVRVREQTICDARERDRGCIRTRNDREDAIVDKML